MTLYLAVGGKGSDGWKLNVFRGLIFFLCQCSFLFYFLWNNKLYFSVAKYFLLYFLWSDYCLKWILPYVKLLGTEKLLVTYESNQPCIMKNVIYIRILCLRGSVNLWHWRGTRQYLIMKWWLGSHTKLYQEANKFFHYWSFYH